MYVQRSIAIIDDDFDVRSSLASVLRSHGICNEVYASADDFIDTQRWSCGCIVSDFQMPGTSGLELLRSMRAVGETMPFVIMTAFSNAKLQAEAAANRAILVEKPLNADRLIALLAELMFVGPLKP